MNGDERKWKAEGNEGEMNKTLNDVVSFSYRGAIVKLMAVLQNGWNQQAVTGQVEGQATRKGRECKFDIDNILHYRINKRNIQLSIATE